MAVALFGRAPSIKRIPESDGDGGGPGGRRGESGGALAVWEPEAALEAAEGKAAAEKHSELKANMVNHMFTFDGLTPGIMYRLRIAGVSSIGQVHSRRSRWCSGVDSHCLHST